ncbi:MAG TPA: hydroxysqualene dehydroxylase HpnE [Roseiarcus sp.]|nr:hydroxysqualene dehydroxylase HpnE [Roseiarcus sp.]
MKRPTVHVIGAGFSGLSAAVHLAATPNADVVVHESAAQAGGRRRSFYDDATSMTIDNGNDLALSSWRSALAMFEAIGARAQWREAAPEGIAFADMASGERWTLRPNRGPLPWWVFDPRRRAPRTGLKDYWPAARLLLGAPATALLRDYAPSAGPAAERLWRPFALAALNTDLDRASARLAGAALRETLRGGARPLMPVHGLTRAFVEPALKTLRRRGVAIRFERRLAALDFHGEHVAGLEFEHDRIDLAPGDAVIVATPPRVAAALAPGLSAPQEFNGAISAHFAIPAPPGAPPILGIVNGAFHWMFCGDSRISVAIKDAEASMAAPLEKQAADLWRDVAALTGLSDATPAWRVIRQRRATFAATPGEDARRPSLETSWRNLFLAGAYVQNGLPDTLESAVRSGVAAAERARKWLDAP